MSNKAALSLTVDALERLHKYWKPHTGQVRAGRKLFKDNISRIFIQCGRKWGKTEFAIYVMLRWAALNQGAAVYYVAPTIDQAREIMWERLKEFIKGASFKFEKNESHLRIRLDNGSFIKLEGADNFENRRGITPSLVVADELKDIKEGWWAAMEPNLAPLNAPIIFLGTPPDHDCLYTQLADQFRVDPKAHWETAPTHENPSIGKEWLDDTRQRHIDRGEIDVWEREYLGRYVKGGSRSIFPMFKQEKPHVWDHDELYSQHVYRDHHKLDWYLSADPGTATRFGGLFIALNRYSRTIFVLDEIYEGRAEHATVGRIWPVMRDKMSALAPTVLPHGDDWFRVYDEAAAWFCAEINERFGIGFSPTHKARIDKESGLSLIKDQMLQGRLMISSRCKHLIWELENYIKDESGKIPKKNDHLIDCLRYFNQASAYSMSEQQEPAPPDEADIAFKRYTPERDMEELSGGINDLPENDY